MHPITARTPNKILWVVVRIRHWAQCVCPHNINNYYVIIITPCRGDLCNIYIFYSFSNGVTHLPPQWFSMYITPHVVGILNIPSWYNASFVLLLQHRKFVVVWYGAHEGGGGVRSQSLFETSWFVKIYFYEMSPSFYCNQLQYKYM